MTEPPPTDDVVATSAASELSEPPPSRDSSILSTPPETPKELKKKISLSDKPKSFKIKSQPSSASQPSKRSTNGTPKKVQEMSSPEASTSKTLPEPTPMPRSIPGSIDEDWQVPYIFAFVDKFFDGDVKDSNTRIKGLFTIEDLERGLLADFPEDVMVEIIVRFLNNLQKKLGKKADMDTLTSNLSSFISSRLQPGTPSTVWDEYLYTPYVQQPIKKKSKSSAAAAAPVINGKGKGKARDSAAMDVDVDVDIEDPSVKAAREKHERLLRNPLLEKGLWELSWHERSTLLRQMVDWQLIEHQETREYIDELYPAKKKRSIEGTAITTEPINKDSDNKRIWIFEPTYRIYTQTNPLHFASEWRLISSTKQEYMHHLDRFKASAESVAEKTKAKKSAKGKAQKAALMRIEAGAIRDGEIAKVLEARLPELEAFEVDLLQERTKLAALQERNRKARETREKRVALDAQYMAAGPRRSGRHVVNYAEVQEEDPEDEEDYVEYAAHARKRRAPHDPQLDTANGTAIGTGTNGTLTPAERSGSEDEDEDEDLASQATSKSYQGEEDEGDDDDGGEDDIVSDDELDGHKRAGSFADDDLARPTKKRRLESISSDGYEQ